MSTREADKAQQFGELRAMLHSASWDFEQLCTFLDTSPLDRETLEQEFLPYAQAACAHKRDQDLTLDVDQAQAALEQDQLPVSWPLARGIALSKPALALRHPEPLSKLTSLDLFIRDDETETAITLINALPVQTLTSLSLSGDAPSCAADRGEALLRALVKRGFTQLKKLRFSAFLLEDGSPTLFERLPSSLEALELHSVYMPNPKTGGRLARANLPRLKRLTINGAGLDPGGIQSLSDAGWFSTLEHLSLNDNSVDARALKTILDRVFALKTLALDHSRLSTGAWLDHIQHPGWAHIEQLSLNWLYTLGDEAIIAMCEQPTFKHLTHLSLIWDDLGPQAARALASSPHITQLKQLDLYRNNILDSGAQALSESANMAQLEYLRVHENSISDQGRARLRQSPHLARCIDSYGAHGF